MPRYSRCARRLCDEAAPRMDRQFLLAASAAKCQCCDHAEDEHDADDFCSIENKAEKSDAEHDSRKRFETVKKCRDRRRDIFEALEVATEGAHRTESNDVEVEDAARWRPRHQEEVGRRKDPENGAADSHTPADQYINGYALHHRLGLDSAEGARCRGKNAPESAFNRQVDCVEASLRHDECDATGCKQERKPFDLEYAPLFGKGRPGDHEERTCRHHEGGGRGIRTFDGEKKRELNDEKSETVDRDVEKILAFMERREDVAPFDESRVGEQQKTGASEAQRREVDGAKPAVFHQELRRNAHRSPEEAGQGGKHNT